MTKMIVISALYLLISIITIIYIIYIINIISLITIYHCNFDCFIFLSFLSNLLYFTHTYTYMRMRAGVYKNSILIIYDNNFFFHIFRTIITLKN